MDFEKKISVYRGIIEESIHLGAAAVVNVSGQLIHSVGNPELVTFPRSALKFIQAVALVETGAAKAYRLDQRHLALACASHMGEPQHIELVESWLQQLGLIENQLACGHDYPLDKQAYQNALKSGSEPRRIFHNCSGKHTGFLTLCKHLDYSVEGYHQLKHPVQQLFVENLSYFTELDASGFSWHIDGCGFPAPALQLNQMAYAMARFADPSALSKPKALAVRELHEAIANEPEYMSGTNDLAAHVIRATQGKVLVKIGAEGYFVAVVPEQKIGMALKISDGSARGVEMFLVSLLDELELLDSSAKKQLKTFLHPQILNSRGETVGNILPCDIC